jgi:hypothetical protein
MSALDGFSAQSCHSSGMNFSKANNWNRPEVAIPVITSNSYQKILTHLFHFNKKGPQKVALVVGGITELLEQVSSISNNNQAKQHK